MRKISLAFLCLVSGGIMAHAQQPWTTIPLNDLSAFNNPGKNWSVAASASTDFNQPSGIKPANGTGIIINTVGSSNNSHLVTSAQMGDVELELEFMMAKGSNSGVYLQGRYEVQLFDSWMKQNPTYSDCGGIYQRWDESKPSHEGYQGVAPLQNVAKAPGLWQKLVIKFHAPTFNTNGVKTANAWFESVYLNGVPVQLHIAVTGPTRSAMFMDEKAQGPLVLQGDHGNVAFRNIRYRSLTPAAQKNNPGDNPIVITADTKPYLLRSFLNYGAKKLTHVISAGYPGQLNYSYDLKQGALIQVWRGQFLDVTDMWHERGEPQLAKPLGALMMLNDAPALAVLPNNDAAWPDSVAFDDFHNKGYVLDARRYATYEYEFNGIHVFDKISAQGTGLTRELTIANAPASLYCRVAAAGKIEEVSNGLYAVGDGSFYIQTGDGTKPLLRKTASGAELLLPAGAGSSTLSYAIIW